MNLFKLIQRVPKRDRYAKGDTVYVNGRRAAVIVDTGRQVNIVYTWGLWNGRGAFVERNQIDKKGDSWENLSY